MTPNNTKPGFIIKTQKQALSLNICKKICYALTICLTICLIINLVIELITGFFFPGFQAIAGDEAGRLHKQVIKIIDKGCITQIKENAWEKKKTELTSRKPPLLSEKEQLEKVKTCLEKKLKIQNLVINEAKRKIKEAELIRTNIHSYLESVIDELEESIKRGLPFLADERNARILSIKETLERPDKTGAEKYRRVMEALQIETEYGRTAEVYSEIINLDGQSVLVDILRLGRLALYCRTPDKKKTAYYDKIEKKWLLFSRGSSHEIGKAIEMARHERISDLARLPIGRIIIK